MRWLAFVLGRRLVFLLALAAAGCSTQPAYERPPVELPSAWKESAPRYAEDGRWWRIYEDPQLEALVDESFAKNSDLVIAAARVDEARAFVGEAESGFYPTLDARGSAARQRISQRTATSFPGIPTDFSDYRATLNVSYELDLFGRIRSGARESGS